MRGGSRQPAELRCDALHFHRRVMEPFAPAVDVAAGKQRTRPVLAGCNLGCVCDALSFDRNGATRVLERSDPVGAGFRSREAAVTELPVFVVAPAVDVAVRQHQTRVLIAGRHLQRGCGCRAHHHEKGKARSHHGEAEPTRPNADAPAGRASVATSQRRARNHIPRRGLNPGPPLLPPHIRAPRSSPQIGPTILARVDYQGGHCRRRVRWARLSASSAVAECICPSPSRQPCCRRRSRFRFRVIAALADRSCGGRGFEYGTSGPAPMHSSGLEPPRENSPQSPQPIRPVKNRLAASDVSGLPPGRGSLAAATGAGQSA